MKKTTLLKFQNLVVCELKTLNRGCQCEYFESRSPGFGEQRRENEYRMRVWQQGFLRESKRENACESGDPSRSTSGFFCVCQRKEDSMKPRHYIRSEGSPGLMKLVLLKYPLPT